MLIFRKDKNIKGYSMVEILLVIVIMAIIATIASSMFGKHVQRIKLKEVASAIMSDMKLAKQRSAAESVNYEITFDLTNHGYTISGGSYNLTKKLSDFGENIKIVESKFTNNKVTFQPRGTLSGAAGSIILENSLGSKVKIIVSLMGKVRCE